MSWSTFELRVRLAPLNRLKPSSKIFYWPFQGATSFVDLLCFCSVVCLLCLCARLFICALWSSAGKGLTSWLSCVVSNCEFVTFPLVSWVRCGTWLYWFLIFAPFILCNEKNEKRTLCFTSGHFNLKYLNCGHVRMFVTLSIIFCTIYLYDLAQNCTDKS